MPYIPVYVKCLPDVDTIAYTVVKATAVTQGDSITTGYKIVCDADFTTKPINIDNTPHEKTGTYAIECIYKNAVGTLKAQQSVSGLIWTDITDATLTLVDSGTEQVQTLNLSVGAYGGNYLRLSWDGAGTGYLIINVA